MTDASQLTLELGGRWHGCYGAAPCPVCQPERRKGQNALTLADGRTGRLALHCKKTACAFLDILAAAGIRSGEYTPPNAATLAQREAEQHVDAEKRAAQAKRLWDEAQPIDGTAAATYLRGRGISCPLPSTLRFHGSCLHGPTARRYPAMAALVQDGDGFSVHRTYLRADGLGKAAVDPAKMMLGQTAGGAVRLSDGAGPLLVAEGIETTLSAWLLTDHPPARVWAALSTSGMQSLRLPSEPDKLILAPDGDKAGRAAALALADRASRAGWAVSILTPPDAGDFNDFLRARL